MLSVSKSKRLYKTGQLCNTLALNCHTQTSFIVTSNKGRLPASGLGAKRPVNCQIFLMCHRGNIRVAAARFPSESLPPFLSSICLSLHAAHMAHVTACFTLTRRDSFALRVHTVTGR